MTTDDLKKTLTDLQTAVDAADKKLAIMAGDEHMKKCPLIASARVATSAAHLRLDNALAWLAQNPVPPPVAASGNSAASVPPKK